MVVATILGFALRTNGYAEVPPITQNADELQFAWLGLSLWQHGIPLTWAYFGPYPHPQDLHLHGTVYPLVHPWFDHPPLFGLITGGAALLAGQTAFAAVDMASVRAPVLVFATATIPLVYQLGRRLLGVPVAVVGALLVAVSPPLVLLSRVAEPEALLAPLFLGALLLAVRRVTGPVRRWELPVLLAICVIAPLAKITGVGIAGAVAVIFLARGGLREAGLCAAAGLASLAIFAVYGAVFGWQTFLDAIAAQDAHRTGVMAGLEFIAAFAGNNHHLYDGWWLLGWLGIAALAVRGEDRPGLFLAWPVVAYLVLIVIAANQQWVATYGWYRVAVYPLVYLGAAELAWQLVRAPSPAVSALVLALGGATAVEWWLGAPWVAPAAVAVAAFGLVILSAVRSPQAASRIGYAALAVMGIGCLVQSLMVSGIAGAL